MPPFLPGEGSTGFRDLVHSSKMDLLGGTAGTGWYITVGGDGHRQAHRFLERPCIAGINCARTAPPCGRGEMPRLSRNPYPPAGRARVYPGVPFSNGHPFLTGNGSYFRTITQIASIILLIWLAEKARIVYTLPRYSVKLLQ